MEHEPEHPLMEEAQLSILRDVLRWALPAMAAMSTATLTTSLLTGMFAATWSRGVPSLVMLAFITIATLRYRAGHLKRAVAWLIGGVGSVLAITLTFNGGVRAPAAMLFIYLVALCGWAFGRRAATVMSLVAFMVLTLAFTLGAQHVLPEPPTLPLVGQYVMLVVMTALAWSTSATPPERMREAVLRAAQREEELKAEQARRLETANQFQAVFDQSPHLLGLVSPDGILRSVNRAALTFAGTDASSQVGQRFVDAPWWPEAQREEVERRLSRAVHGVERFETTLVDTTGATRSLDFTLSAFRDAGGELRYLIAEGRDVTAAVQTKERRHTTQRLELVGQLAGGVAHDFNNVLMAILSSAEVMRLDLREAGQESAELTESLDTIAAAGERASDLTRRLLSFARRSSVERKAVSMDALLDATTRLLERTLPANLKLVRAWGTKGDVVRGDLAALESALLNLALNARDAMPSGGTLTFSSERLELDADACAATGFDVKPGAFIRLSVRDTGTGISRETLPHVFEPFFTTKDEGKGTGLGLPSVFGVVREHGGAVHLESELGRGTVFHLTLPLSTDSAPAPKPAVRGQGFAGLQALVVDDEPALRATLPRLLKQLGITCTVAASAEEALRLYQPSQHLLVSDIVLAGRRGNELAAELLEQHPALRVLLISGFARDSDLSSLPQARLRMLAKPFTFEQLEATLTDLMSS